MRTCELCTHTRNARIVGIVQVYLVYTYFLVSYRQDWSAATLTVVKKISDKNARAFLSKKICAKNATENTPELIKPKSPSYF